MYERCVTTEDKPIRTTAFRNCINKELSVKGFHIYFDGAFFAGGILNRLFERAAVKFGRIISLRILITADTYTVSSAMRRSRGMIVSRMPWIAFPQQRYFRRKLIPR